MNQEQKFTLPPGAQRMEIPKPHQVQCSLHQSRLWSCIQGQAEDSVCSTKASSKHGSAHPVHSEYGDHQRCQANGETSGKQS